jgi:hypothetical protein
MAKGQLAAGHERSTDLSLRGPPCDPVASMEQVRNEDPVLMGIPLIFTNCGR